MLLFPLGRSARSEASVHLCRYSHRAVGVCVCLCGELRHARAPSLRGGQSSPAMALNIVVIDCTRALFFSLSSPFAGALTQGCGDACRLTLCDDTMPPFSMCTACRVLASVAYPYRLTSSPSSCPHSTYAMLREMANNCTFPAAPSRCTKGTPITHFQLRRHAARREHVIND